MSHKEEEPYISRSYCGIVQGENKRKIHYVGYASDVAMSTWKSVVTSWYILKKKSPLLDFSLQIWYFWCDQPNQFTNIINLMWNKLPNAILLRKKKGINRCPVRKENNCCWRKKWYLQYSEKIWGSRKKSVEISIHFPIFV